MLVCDVDGAPVLRATLACSAPAADRITVDITPSTRPLHQARDMLPALGVARR
ncbi:hypothetical protein [Streptomyces sp. NPDC051776]|uniref:hypothetical protein n=1 Tax=Streptomyces sp. NPDC051776 TaxID=3155414 RepID=UPI00343EBFDA